MLSIIIPTLNEEKYLEELLKSIEKQAFKDYEIIVADAGSRDRTLEIAKNHGCIIVRGGLPARGRNEGAKEALGDLLLFLDADTKFPTKDFLKKAILEFRKRNLDVASCGLAPLEKSKFVKQELLKMFFEVSNYLMITFERIAPFGVGSMILIKKEFHLKMGGFDEHIRFGEDTVYIRKAAKLGKFGILKRVKIFWSIRRFEKEKWLKPVFLYILGWFLIGLDKKRLDIYKKGFFEYRFGHYQDLETKAKNNFVNDLPGLKIFKQFFKNKLR
ncbi:MAG: glycosyltransferase [Candidatus Nealsonbacteria bacterium]|nr:glycosyltransferase [Candidatus Nealsonbacteria bacterium]